MQTARLLKTGAVSVTVAALAMGLAGPASADVQPQAKDAVGVGSDTVQYVADFVNDGSPLGALGYNTANTGRRAFSFDATADASGRSSYQNGTSTALSSTVVLRAGSKPVARPNGSGAGITALLNDSAHQIDFVRSSRLPKASEQASAASFGGIHVYQIATDGLQVAVAHAATNAPAGLDAAELAKIYNGTYKTWGDIPGYVGANSNHGIVPIIPQAGSGTRNDFIADIKSLTGVDLAVAGALTGTVKTAEEHDPAAITSVVSSNDANGNPVSAADAISPFSTGRDKLIDTGYFGTTPAPNTIDLLTGATPAATTAYVLNRTLYLLARQSDAISATPFQAGGSQNLVNALFGKNTSWYGKGANAPLFTAAGVTQSWADLGNTISAG
jgi:ABC-type phosphate transport system substrate-binding protein